MGGPDDGPPPMATSDTLVVDVCGRSVAADGYRSAALPGLSIRLEEELGADVRPVT